MTIHHARPSSRSRRRLSMLVAAFGTVIEWYDFSVFFYVATSLTNTFFDGHSNSLLLTLGVGAAGFVFRPVGAMVFGHIGDRIGRRAALVISAGLMAIAMFGIAALPGSDVLGVWAGLGMIALRCLAGFSVGAEYTGIMVFLMESARDGRRGLAASWAAANSEIGSLLAVAGGFFMANTLSSSAMDAWGWRLLFVLGGLLAAVMIPLRGLMEETDSFKKANQARSVDEKPPLLQVLLGQPKAVAVAFFISTIGSVSYFLNITYIPTYLEQSAHLPSSASLSLGTVAAIVAVVVTPLIGLASDHVGRKAMLLLITLVLLLTTLPAYLLLGASSDSGIVLGAAFLAIPAAGWSAVAASAIPEQFTVAGRFSGMAIGYNLATVLFGGLSPLVATWLMQTTGSPLMPAFYATGVILLAGIPAWFLLRETAHHSLRHVDAPPAATPATV